MKKEVNYQELSKEELIKLLLKKEDDFNKKIEEYEAKFIEIARLVPFKKKAVLCG